MRYWVITFLVLGHFLSRTLYSKQILCFVNASGRNFSPIFAKFGTRMAKVFLKAEFVCDRKRK